MNFAGYAENPETRAVKTGSALALTCEVSGDEPYSLVWLKNGVPVVSAAAIFDIPENWDPLTLTMVNMNTLADKYHGKHEYPGIQIPW